MRRREHKGKWKRWEGMEGRGRRGVARQKRRHAETSKAIGFSVREVKRAISFRIV
jgi:hypothetical protein